MEREIPKVSQTNFPITQQLRLGDCIELMWDIPDSSIDMICCDMPYGVTKCKWDTPINLSKLWEGYKRITKENAAILLFAQTPFDKVLGCSNINWLRYEIIWEKAQPTGFLNAKRMPMKSHENILVFYKKLPTYNPQKTYGHIRKSAKKVKYECKIYGKQAFDGLTYDSTERYPRSVLRFPKDTQTNSLHPTQKPVDLIKWLVKTYSKEGDIILDNCMGSGTTGVACASLNRCFIGMEIDDEIFGIAKDRLTNRQEI